MSRNGSIRPITIILWIILFTVVFTDVAQAAFTDPPTNITAESLPSGTIQLNWTAAQTDGTPAAGDIRYEVYRKARDTGTYYRLTDELNAVSFTDRIDANDPSTNGNDTRNDGTTGDPTNLVWGLTYQYKILARDVNDPPASNTYPTTLDNAVTIAAQCDDRAPELLELQEGPVYEGFVQAKAHTIRTNIHYVDWSDFTGDGSFKISYKINGGADVIGPATMTKLSGGYSGATILEGTLDLSTAAHNDAVEWWISGQDNHRNPMVSSIYPHQLLTDSVFLLTVDTQGPQITNTIYIDFSGDGVSSDDQWVLRFDEDLVVDDANLAATDFTLGPTVGGTFGTGATAFHGPLTNEITIVLGASPNLKFVGASLINQINYKGEPQVYTIKDKAGNVAQNNVYTVVARNATPPGDDLPDSPRPKITKVEFTDVNDDGDFNNPDTLKITLDKRAGNIGANPATDYVLPVTSDGFGAGATQAIDGTDKKLITVTLAAGAVMRVVGEFNAGALTAGSSSGLDGAAATGVVDDFGNMIEQKAPDAGVDITGTGTTPPKVTSAVYRDTLVSNVRDGLSSGDRVTVGFDRPLHLGLRPIESISFNVPVGTDNLDGPTFTINPANRRELFIDFSSNPSLTVYGTYNGINATGNPSGIDVATGLYAEGIVDIYGNVALPVAPVDIGADDTDGPRITPATDNPNAVLFTDLDGNGPDEGDYLEIEFDEPIIITSPVAADFQMQNLNFGAGAIIAAKDTGVNNRVIRVTLGTSPTLATVAPTPSRIDLVNNTSRIKNWADINARSDGFRNVVAASALGPVVTKAEYTDNGTDGMNAGDFIDLTFDKPIIVGGGASSADFQLPVTGNTLGTGSTITTAGLNADQLRITLGATPVLKIGGVFNLGVVTAGSPSGLDITAGGTANIQDTLGNNARPNTPVGVDITSTDATAPRLAVATFTDVGGDGLTAGDQILLQFTEPIIVEVPPSPVSLRNLAFRLPVSGDNLGQDPATVVMPQPQPNQILLQFITAPTLKIAGTYNGNVAAGSSSGIDVSPTIPQGMITDVSGNTATVNPGTVGVNGVIDIGTTDAAAPTLLSAAYTDINNDGPGLGDFVDVTFSEPILVNPTGVPVDLTHFAVGNGNLGTGATFTAYSTAVNNAILRITLGNNPTLNFNPPNSPNTNIDVSGNLLSITDISGNGAVASTAKDITNGSTEPPYVINAFFTDNDDNGVDQGDTILVGFNEAIFLGAVVATDFQVPATDGGTRTDSLGTGVFFTKTDNRTVEITLGNNPVLYIPGTYSGTTGKASGIDIAAAGTVNIVDSLNNGAMARTTGPVDLVSADTRGPKLIESYWSDVNSNGAVDSGDTLSVRFDIPILIGTNLSPAAFNLPVTGDQLNFSNFTAMGTDSIYFTLSTPVTFLPRGTYNGTTTAGSASGISISSSGFPVGSIISESGADATPSTIVDIFSRDGTGPVLMAAEYEDANRSSSVDAGDIVSITFSEPIMIGSPTLADFNLVNANFGLNPVFGPGGGSNILKITLASGATLTFLGTATSSVDVLSVITTITDFSGNGCGQTTQKFITVKGAAEGPRIVSSVWTDIAPAGISQGDLLHIGFNKDIVTAAMDSNDFVLPVGAPPSTGPADTLGTGPVFSQTDTRTIEIILGVAPVINPIGLFNAVNITPGSPSGIGISTGGTTSGHIVDSFGYLVEQNTPPGVDIGSSDLTGPVLISAVFRDLDLNAVDEGDQLIINFDENIVVQTPISVAGGDFTITNGSLGTNPTFYYNGTAPTQLIITLGASPSVTIAGIYPTDAAATGIDINGILSGTPVSITDVSGLSAHTNGGVDITPYELDGPAVIGSRYVDANNTNAVDFGDYVYVRFNEPVQFSGVTFSDFTTPVALDSIGGSPVFAPGNDGLEIRIQLGSAPILTPTGVFRVGVITGGSPSGIDVVNTTHITDVYGNPARATNSRDIDDGQGPYIIAAAYTDLDNNAVDEGDLLKLTFSEPVQINQALIREYFEVPVGLDSLGDNPTFMLGTDTTEIDITLGTNSVLTIPTSYSPLRLGVNDPSGINLSVNFLAFAITDASGNSAVRSATGVDITGTDITRPTLQASRWIDYGSTGVGAGDHLILTFDRLVQASVLTTSDFTLPVAQNLLGSPLAVTPNTPNTFTNEVHLILGAGARLTVPGEYTVNVHGANDPSGIDISPAMVAGHIMDVYGNTAQNSTVKDIAGDGGTGPVLINCTYWDTDNNGPDLGDILGLAFDKPIMFRNGVVPGINELDLPITGNSFGSNPVITAGTTSIDLRIQLGDNPVLTIPGTFIDTTSTVDPASPSGIRTVGLPTGTLIDYSGNVAYAMAVTASVDIQSASTVGPSLLSATIQDQNTNYQMDQGDRMILVFDRAIAITPAFALTDLNLPVVADSFGAAATFEVNTANRAQLFIGLGAGPNFTVEGIHNPLLTVANSSSGIGVNTGVVTITDLGGMPVQGGPVFDITDEYRPYILAATYADTGNNGLGLGDLINIRFSETIFSAGITATDFSLSGTADSLGTGATYAQSATDSIRITLGTNPALTIAGSYPTDPTATGIDLATTFNNGHIRDLASNPAIRTTYKDISPEDVTAPTVTRALYGDVNGNGVVDGGDTISVFFTHTITVSGAVRDDFSVINGNFGTGGNDAVVRGSATNEVIITLGNAPILDVSNIYPTDATASALDIGVGYVAGHILTVAGANPISSTPKDIEDLLGPLPVSAVYTDTGLDGVGAADILEITFSRAIQINGTASAAHFFLPVAGNSLGSNPSFSLAAVNRLRITLGSSANLRVSGVFNNSNLTIGSASGFNVSSQAISTITDLAGNPIRPALQAIDITGVDVTAPTLDTVLFVDRDGNGVTPGDELKLTFSEPMFIDSAISLSDFNLANGTLGASPTFRISTTNNKELVIVLGTGAAINLFGSNQSSIGRADATYVPGHISDVTGTDWAFGSQTAIQASGTVSPSVVQAIFTDVDGLGLGPGDVINLRFNNPVVVGTGASVNDFVLPVSGDSFGGSATVRAGSSNRDVEIVIGIGARITIAGLYQNGVVTAGSASGVDVNISSANITSIGGDPAVANTIALDIGSTDGTAPMFTSAVLTGSQGANYIRAAADSVLLEAVLDDPSLRAADIKADLTALGGGSSVAASGYVAGRATWSSIATVNLRDSVEVILSAKDLAGNAASYKVRADIIQPARAVTVEITPNTVLRGSGNHEFKVWLVPDLPDYATGFDQITIYVPVTGVLSSQYYYSDLDITATQVVVGIETMRVISSGTPAPGEARVTLDAVAGKVYVLLGTLLKSTNAPVGPVTVTFKAKVPEYSDEPNGKKFSVTVNNSTDPAELYAKNGNADGTLGNGDSNLITVIGVKINSISEEFVITPNFWKIIFTVKFNSNMDIETIPYVTFRPVDSLLNEQSVQQLSFVDSTWMGQVIVPFENFGFAGQYKLTVNNARDYIGSSVNSISLTKQFSPKFLIAAYIHPTDEKTLVVSTRYLQATTEEVLMNKPTMTVQQTGTGEATLVSLFETARADTFLGNYTIDPKLSGTAQIEVEGYIGPSGQLIKGKASTEFSTAMMTAAAGGTLASPNREFMVDIASGVLSRDAQVTILPDLTDQYPQAAANMAPNRPSRAASAEELQRLSAVYMLSPGGVEVKKNFHLSMAQPTGADTHTGIFRMTNSGWEFLGRNLVDGRLSAATDGFGQFAIFRDLKAPVVELPKDDGTEYEKEYVFSLKDKGAGIDVVATKLFLDGDPVTTRYDESKEEMTVILPSRLVQGLHELSGDVVDKLGNSAPLQQAPLRAAGFMDVLNVMPWPNPAVITSRIRYTLGKTVTSLSLRIYDGSGRTVHKMNNFGPADMTAGNHDSPIWMLTNDSMRAVANGTYFFRVIAKDAEGKQVVRTGKIAVLR